MADQPYSKAPITEAVIEIRFVAPVPQAALIKVNDAFSKYYPTLQEFQQVQFQFEASAEGGVTPLHPSPAAKQFRRSASDEQEVLMLTANGLIVSQLAPYCGWDLFFERFQRDWKVWVKEAGRLKIGRIGMRYINRLDIPNGSDNLIVQSEYIGVNVSAPQSFGPTISYAIQAVFDMPSKIGKAVINTSILPFVLVPGFTSVNVDIDLGVDTEVPQKDAAISDVLTQMRNDKNFLFEQMITDKTREMIK